jgi:hypothetical protein
VVRETSAAASTDMRDSVARCLIASSNASKHLRLLQLHLERFQTAPHFQAIPFCTCGISNAPPIEVRIDRRASARSSARSGDVGSAKLGSIIGGNEFVGEELSLARISGCDQGNDVGFGRLRIR